jgi:glycosyltransferase involved in cell wall biosynthesis
MTPIGFGDKVAWEAMACGKPCLVANEGFRETLGKYTQCLLFGYRVSQDLASRLVTLLTCSQGERDEMGRYLRQQVVQMHSLDSLAGNLINLFQEIRQHQR